MKRLIGWFLLLFLFSCAHAPSDNGGSLPVENPPVVDIPSDPTTPGPELSELIKVIDYQGYNDSNKERLKKAVIKSNEVLKSQCFSDFMLKRALIQTNDLTRQEVVDYIRSNQAEIILVYYNKYFSYVNGYTYPDTNKVWINWKYYKNYGSCSMGSNISHEWTHKIGFGHDYNPNTQRPFSVPYSVNAAFEACCVD